jgi:gliding motility associated protien GldN
MMAQQLPKSFFDSKGNLRMETQELADNADTLVSIFHRSDDIVWDRVIYRIIDMRYKQNFQLYFPMRADHERYHNLLNVIANAVVDGMPIYSPENNVSGGKINPDYSETAILNSSEIPNMFMVLPPEKQKPDVDLVEEYQQYSDITSSDAMLIHSTDSADIHAKLVGNYNNFELLVRNQLKYLIQEVVFFDKHTSRLYSKIIGIAPLYQRKIADQEYVTNEDYRNALLQSIMFWIAFDDLRPYLAKQYMIPTNNEAKRVTYEEFFQKRLYSSYIVAESNMYDRMILDYAVKPEDVAKEQERIATSLLTFEQDLWEY